MFVKQSEISANFKIFNEFTGGNSDYLKKSKQNKFSQYLIVRRTQADKTSIEAEEEGKVILDLLLVIYVFEEKKKVFLRAFFML